MGFKSLAARGFLFNFDCLKSSINSSKIEPKHQGLVVVPPNTGAIDVIYSATTNGTVVKNCDKENEGAFHVELKLSCQLAEQPMPI